MLRHRMMMAASGLLVPDDGGGQSFLVQDTFTDADGTLLVNHAPDTDTVGSGWQGHGSTDIQGNALRFVGDENSNWIDCGASDVLITAYWTPESGGRNFLMGRLGSGFTQGSSDFVGLNIREPNQDITIKDGAVEKVSTSYSWNATTTYKVQLELIGDGIRALVDDVEVLTTTISRNQSSTLHGLQRASSVNATRFDDFTVEAAS